MRDDRDKYLVSKPGDKPPVIMLLVYGSRHWNLQGGSWSKTAIKTWHVMGDMEAKTKVRRALMNKARKKKKKQQATEGLHHATSCHIEHSSGKSTSNIQECSSSEATADTTHALMSWKGGIGNRQSAWWRRRLWNLLVQQDCRGNAPLL